MPSSCYLSVNHGSSWFIPIVLERARRYKSWGCRLRGFIMHAWKLSTESSLWIPGGLFLLILIDVYFPLMLINLMWSRNVYLKCTMPCVPQMAGYICDVPYYQLFEHKYFLNDPWIYCALWLAYRTKCFHLFGGWHCESRGWLAHWMHISHVNRRMSQMRDKQMASCARIRWSHIHISHIQVNLMLSLYILIIIGYFMLKVNACLRT